MTNNIPRINYELLNAYDKVEQKKLQNAVTKWGFLIMINYPIDIKKIEKAFLLYKKFFKQSYIEKNKVSMTQTESNRGWGGIKAEKVNPDYNPDNKEIFDCGPTINKKHKFQNLNYYSKNIWPQKPVLFQNYIMEFYELCNEIALSILKQIELSLGYSNNYFADKFDLPMALLRCNYYPKRTKELTKKDYGIAPHTDYGCLTLLFTEGDSGLEVELPTKQWETIKAKKNEIIINFGEMLEIWSNKKIKATPHRVIGNNNERFSIPFFFNPQHDTIISQKLNLKAGDYLSQRYNETYIHKIE